MGEKEFGTVKEYDGVQYRKNYEGRNWDVVRIVSTGGETSTEDRIERRGAIGIGQQPRKSLWKYQSDK